MNKTYTTALVLGLALALLVTFSPVLAHPYWEGEDGEPIVPPWMGDVEDMPHWDENGTYPMPYWGGNESIRMPHWYYNESMPEGFFGEDGYYCPGPIWADPEGLEEGTPAPVPRKRGYGCGMSSGRGFQGGRGRQPRGPTRWSG